MARRKFDHLMLHLEAGTNVKLCRFTDSERCAWILGVLPLAAKSEVRGALLIAGVAPVDALDISRQASVKVSAARSMLAKAEAMGMVEQDDRGWWWVHDFEEHQPRPKQDTTAAERQQRKRARDKAAVTHLSRRDVTPCHADVTPDEVEVEVEEQQTSKATPIDLIACGKGDLHDATQPTMRESAGVGQPNLSVVEGESA